MIALVDSYFMKLSKINDNHWLVLYLPYCKWKESM